AIVFEGNLPSDLDRNTALRQLIDSEAPADLRSTSPRIWLGDAVEIGDPTSFQLERHAGSNLLLVGQEADVVQGLFSAAALAIALQQSASRPPNNDDGAVDEPTIWLFD